MDSILTKFIGQDLQDSLNFYSVENITKQHEVQLVNYLNGIKKDIGLLINFGPSGVEVKRKYRRAQDMG